MATRQQKRVSQQEIKRETETTEDGRKYMDDQASEDLDKAEALLEQRRRLKKESPSKAKKSLRRQSRSSSENDSEEDGEDEKSHDSELDSFIVDDEEVEEDFVPKEKKHKKKRRTDDYKPLDEEELELIRENIGVDPKKKKRLKKQAALENSPEAKNQIKSEPVMIDTMPPRQQSMRIKQNYDELEEPVIKRQKTEDESNQKQQADSDVRRKGQNIFGDQNDQNRVQQAKASDAKTVVSATTLKDFFNSDEIDDPFNTEADFKIAETDIPERLQIKLEGRLLPESEESTLELRQEAEWILDRIITTHSQYSNLLKMKDASEKIFKVLDMFRVKILDIPMICKYRRYEYEPELNEELVWLVFNFDQEYGKFQRAKQMVTDFLLKIKRSEPRVKSYLDELSYAKSLSEINNFEALIRFLRITNQDALIDQDNRRKQPQRKDEIQVAISNRVPEFAKLCFLDCGQFIENLRERRLLHEPPEPKVSPVSLSSEYLNEIYTEPLEFLTSVCHYAAVELSSQPFIRQQLKNHIRMQGQITTELTDQGKKELDVFHQSYRVKLVKDMPIEKLNNSDLFLDIQQCEQADLLTSKIFLPKSSLDDAFKFFQENYMLESNHSTQWNKMRHEVINKLINSLLIDQLLKEIKEELELQAENYVISQCKYKYADLLSQGPFQDPSLGDLAELQPKKKAEEIIKPKQRICVMGALMHQIDANNYIVTVAVVDKFGVLQAHKDFMRLLPPRMKRRPQQSGQDVQMQEEERGPETEEQKEHTRDKERFKEILRANSVDLIVVAANSLEARRLYKQLNDLASDAKNHENYRKEARVIWGKTEVPKLFALSHNSQKLHKNVQQILKQTISLARFEQDPLTEVLNLWSPITAENQALALCLHPMQKLINQAKLAEGLEEENIKAVNWVGVDLNLVLNHEHMHSQLQFLSGLGPRMAKRLLIKVKQRNEAFSTRGELLKAKIFAFKVYFSVLAFVMIRISDEAFHNSKYEKKSDILDQTRIHHEHYKLAMKIATDACNSSEVADPRDVEKTEQNKNCKQVIANPSLIRSLDLKAYFAQLDMTQQGNMKVVIQHICDEFAAPFKDPRLPRSMSNLMSSETLFYQLIDETERTFKKGHIVTATVTKVIGDVKVICRLENGLIAVIPKNKLLLQQDQKALESEINAGYIVTGRIEDIKFNPQQKDNFELQLNCLEQHLKDHSPYKSYFAKSLGIREDQILAEDLKNQNFNTDPKAKNTGRFIPRRIAHEKFKNISSKRALAELNEVEVGDFVFRPSTRSEDNITLTWKFWNKHYVHLDILEMEKPKGAVIGQRLVIHSESFENLREIVERYIIPCNRLVREVVRSPKWVDTDRFEVVEESLRNEKNADRSRIPYRFAILPQYQQHILLAYLPKDKVVREFIKIRPKGFYFHEQNLSPFVNLVNWFKENWQTKDYQRHIKRQKSPRAIAKIVPQIKETPGEQEDQKVWQDNGGGSVHSYNGNYQNQVASVKTEPALKAYGRGQRGARRDSPGQQWGDQGFKQETQGGRSPNQWAGRDHQEYNYGQQNDAVMQESYGQSDRGYDNQRQHRQRQDDRGGRQADSGAPRNRDCFKCKQPGHIARDCPNQQNEHEDRGGYKRQRRDDNQNSFNRGNNHDGQDGQTAGGWNRQGASSGWN